jgi:hypothetical protein
MNNKKKTVNLHHMWETPKTDMDVVLQNVSQKAEIRSLCEASRDQLLTTSSRLFRNLKHSRRRVTLNKNLLWNFNRFMKAAIEGDRMRLAFAKVAFKSKVTRLGSVTHVLIEQPPTCSGRTRQWPKAHQMAPCFPTYGALEALWKVSWRTSNGAAVCFNSYSSSSSL